MRLRRDYATYLKDFQTTKKNQIQVWLKIERKKNKVKKCKWERKKIFFFSIKSDWELKFSIQINDKWWHTERFRLMDHI